MSASVETSAVVGDTVAADEVIRTESLTKLYPGGILAVDELTCRCGAARSSACSARTARARPRPQGCSRPV